MPSEAKPIKVPCNGCKHHTNHCILKEYSRAWHQEDEPDMGIDFAGGTWQIIQCLGCEAVTFREAWVTSEDPEETVTYYPARSKDALPIKNTFNVPRSLTRIYREAIDAYNGRSFLLSAAGIRALVEGLCAQQKITDGPVVLTDNNGQPLLDAAGQPKTKRLSNLQGKLEGLAEKGILTPQHVSALHETRLMGNEAVHELQRPDAEALKVAIEIIEHTFETVYEIADKLEALKARKQKP